MTGNSPVYNEQGQRVWLKECWRRPGRPFKAPECCNKRSKRIGWNMYRCRSCGARIWPERLWHRLMLRRNPFRDHGSPFRALFRVTRWSP